MSPALSYDHRIVDGREAVTFLVRVKDYIEDPQRLLIDLYCGRLRGDEPVYRRLPFCQDIIDF
jgi:hypothetical protein